MRKTWPTTKAPLPENEQVIGGDANPKMFNDRTAEFEKLFKGVKKPVKPTDKKGGKK